MSKDTFSAITKTFHANGSDTDIRVYNACPYAGRPELQEQHCAEYLSKKDGECEFSCFGDGDAWCANDRCTR